MGGTGTAVGIVSSSASEAFGLLTDIDRLPEWNKIIVKVVEPPETMSCGAEWVVQLKAMGNRWASRSRIEEYDPRRGAFSYRSCTDDGNPSYARWRWTVEPAGDGESRVTVTWELHPQTFWRRALLARVRNRQLRREVPASIDALTRALRKASA
jgi:hypothetical protein